MKFFEAKRLQKDLLNFFDTQKFYSLKYKNFWRGIFFHFFEVGLKSGHGSSIIYCLGGVTEKIVGLFKTKTTKDYSKLSRGGKKPRKPKMKK